MKRKISPFSMIQSFGELHFFSILFKHFAVTEVVLWHILGETHFGLRFRHGFNEPPRVA